MSHTRDSPYLGLSSSVDNKLLETDLSTLHLEELAKIQQPWWAVYKAVLSSTHLLYPVLIPLSSVAWDMPDFHLVLWLALPWLICWVCFEIMHCHSSDFLGWSFELVAVQFQMEGEISWEICIWDWKHLTECLLHCAIKLHLLFPSIVPE